MNHRRKTTKIKFFDNKHEKRYEQICDKMEEVDCYRQSVAYLLTLDDVVYSHINDVYDFCENYPIHDSLDKSWKTGTSRKTTRLIFNLWNGWVYDSDEDFDNNKISGYYAVDEIFCCNLAPYYFEAIKLRYQEYCE